MYIHQFTSFFSIPQIVRNAHRSEITNKTSGKTELLRIEKSPTVPFMIVNNKKEEIIAALEEFIIRPIYNGIKPSVTVRTDFKTT